MRRKINPAINLTLFYNPLALSPLRLTAAVSGGGKGDDNPASHTFTPVLSVFSSLLAFCFFIGGILFRILFYNRSLADNDIHIYLLVDLYFLHILLTFFIGKAKKKLDFYYYKCTVFNRPFQPSSILSLAP